MSSRKFDLTKEERKLIAQKILDTIKKSRYKNMRQYALSKGLPENTFHNWAKKGNINIGFLVRFSDEFKLSLDWLLKG